MNLLGFGAIALLMIGIIVCAYRNIMNRQQAWMSKRLQSVMAQELDAEAITHWQTRTLIRSRLENYARHS